MDEEVPVRPSGIVGLHHPLVRQEDHPQRGPDGSHGEQDPAGSAPEWRRHPGIQPLLDKIQREVKQAWLKADEFEKNIVTVQSAIEQAREGFRISEALFKEQMATSTDVLDARTQLSETMTRYYNALYDFQIAAAALDRATGKPSIDIAEAQ